MSWLVQLCRLIYQHNPFSNNYIYLLYLGSLGLGNTDCILNMANNSNPFSLSPPYTFGTQDTSKDGVKHIISVSFTLQKPLKREHQVSFGSGNKFRLDFYASGACFSAWHVDIKLHWVQLNVIDLGIKTGFYSLPSFRPADHSFSLPS